MDMLGFPSENVGSFVAKYWKIKFWECISNGKGDISFKFL
jgi:hypothetical protein